MAGYNLVMGAKFRPFTYDELVKPINTLTEAQYAAEDAMYEMNAKASLYEQLLGEAEDSASRKMYNDFATALRQGAEDLYRHGYNARTRRGLMAARQAYASNIVPLEEAKKQRDAAIAAQRAANARGNMRFSNYASTSSLDAFLNGKYDYRSVDIDNAYTKAQALGTSWSKRFQNTEEGIAFGGDYFKLVKTVGLDSAQSAEAVQEAQANLKRGVEQMIQSGKYPGLSEALKELIVSTGADSLNDTDYSEVVGALISGLSTGIQYDQNETLQQNWRAQEELRYQNELRKMRAAKAMEQEALNLAMSDLDTESRIAGGVLTEMDKKMLHKKKDGTYEIDNLNDIASRFGVTSFFTKDKKTGKIRAMTEDEFANAVVWNSRNRSNWPKDNKGRIIPGPMGGLGSTTTSGITKSEENKIREQARKNYKAVNKYLNNYGLDLNSSYNRFVYKNNRWVAQTKKEDYDRAQLLVGNAGLSGTEHATLRYQGLGETAKNLTDILRKASSAGNTYSVDKIEDNKYSGQSYKFKEGSEVTQMNYDPAANTFFMTVVEPAEKGKQAKVSKVTVPATNILSDADASQLPALYQAYQTASNDISRQTAMSAINKLVQKSLNKYKPKDKNESF